MSVTASMRIDDSQIKGMFSRLKSFDEADAAVRAGAQIIRNGAAERAPYKTGNLRRSIKEERADESTSTSIIYNVGTNVVYAPAQEFGYQHIPARPYLRPALDQDGKEAVEVIKNAVIQFIEKAV